jgi:hypothetical protein
MSKPEQFDAEIVAAEGGKVRLIVPFNPSDKWGKKARHHVTCRIGKQEFEGSIGSRGGVFFIPLNKEVRAQLKLEADTKVRVELRPERATRPRRRAARPTSPPSSRVPSRAHPRPGRSSSPSPRSIATSTSSGWPPRRRARPVSHAPSPPSSSSRRARSSAEHRTLVACYRDAVDELIRLPLVDTRESYLEGFWRFVERLAANRYDAAVAGLMWPNGKAGDPDRFRQAIEGFYGGDAPWSVIIPNERLVGVINEAAEVALANEPQPGACCDDPAHGHGQGWMLCQIPVTNEPHKAKDDDVVLMGVAASFVLRRHEGGYVMCFEIFHA